jgi:amino acid transporter/mannitol/fructose-specific phosphotransferase system IIA component (Ntr-type)
LKLQRKLGFLDIYCIAAGGMISSGLFVLPGQAFKVAGPAVVLSYALASLLVVPTLLSKCELSTAMPKSGGTYFFIERSMGGLLGTLAGLAGWLSLALKAAFAMIGIGAFAKLIWADAPLNDVQWEWLIKGVASVCCVLFMLMNLFSVKMAGRFQVWMVFALLIVLVIYAFAGVPHVSQHPNFDNFFGNGLEAMFATVGLVFVSYGGLTKIAAIAEEVRNPGRNIPRAVILAFVTVSLLYIFAIFVTVGVTPAEKLAAGQYGDLTPLSTAAGAFLGRWGMVILSFAAIMAFVTTGNAGILSASRSPLAMSRDGLLPEWLAKVSKFGTPHLSIIFTTLFMLAMILALNISDLVKVASTMMMILFLLVNVAVLIMRTSGLQNYRPLFRSPLFPWVQIAGIGLYTALIVEMIIVQKLVAILTTVGFLLGSVVWYFLYAKRHMTRQSALVHLVNKVVAAELRRTELEEELRDIALERDEIEHDRFDRLVQDAPILDMSGQVAAEKLFKQVSLPLANRVGLPAEDIAQRLMQREKTSTTILQPGLAVPHIIVPGENIFALAMVRCRDGAVFNVDLPYVKAAFILLGSQDQRNFHLQALMAIAHIVQSPDFFRRWHGAHSVEHLRDIVLLSDRQRLHETQMPGLRETLGD